MPDSVTRDLPMQVRAASFAPATVDAEKRTVELVWTTGARVPRFDWYRERRYVEELVVTPEAVDMSRLNGGGVPLLDTHRTWGGVTGILGIVERAWLANGEGRAVVRFDAGDEAVDQVWRKVQSGMIRNVSVGYAIRRVEVIEEEGKPPVYRVVDWQPYEISLVPVGADAGAGIRAGETIYPCEFVTTRAPAQTTENPMTTPTPAGGAPAAAPVVPPTDTRAVDPVTPPAPAPAPQADATAVAAATTAERARIAEIGTIARLAGLDDAATRAMIEEGITVDAARARAFTTMASRSPPPRPGITVTTDETDTIRSLAENALLHRYDGATKLEDGARQFRGLTLMELGDALLARHNVSTRGLGKMERAGLMLGLDTRSGGMLTTADYPIVLSNVVNKTLRSAYAAAPQTFRPFTRRVTLPDFKQVTRVQFGDAPTLLKVNEHGEFTSGAIGEAKEVWSLATYGRIVGITRQVLVNDDLDAFTRLPAMFGRRAADLESDIVWAIVTDNAAMGDGTALFHANHANLAAVSTAPSIASLGAARTAMRKQTSIDGVLLNIGARYIMAPPELETGIQQLLAAVTANQNSQVNPFAGAYSPIIEPRLSTNSLTAWYMAAEPSQIDTIEFGYLQGEEGVMVESRVGFEVDGVQVKARLDFGAKAIDHRGLYKNAGA